MPGGAAGDVVAVGVLPAARIAVGGAEEHQHLLAFADGVAADLDLARRGAKEGLHRALVADGFLECVARQRRIAAQLRQLVGKARQAIDSGADAVDGRIDPGREQRTDQQRGLLMGDVAGIGMGMDAGTEPAGREVLALALRGHIGLMRRRALDRFLAQLVRRPECVEHQAGVGQEVFASLLLKAHRVGKDRQRIGFRKVGNGIEAAAREQFVDLGFGERGEMTAERLHRGRRQHLVQHRPRACMRRRIGLQDNARRSPRLFLGKIAQADAAAGAEGLRIVEDGMHLLIARHAIDAPFVEIDDRARHRAASRASETDRRRTRSRTGRSRDAGCRARTLLRRHCCRDHWEPPALCSCRAVRGVSMSEGAEKPGRP